MNSVKFNTLLNERIYCKRLSNAMKCYIIPKIGYAGKHAILGVGYGSADNAFKIGKKRCDMPCGMAHFLEHKLFEDPKANIFEGFMDLQASVNAFTNFTTTAYYFSCNENFDQSLRLLLEFTSRPYFTDENVSKEKPIIVQEIKMYDDNPFWVMYLGLLDALYETSPVKHNIAGSAESIQAITPDTLYKCYRAFYRPENMVLVCAGELEPERVAETAEKYSRQSRETAITRIYGKEPRAAARSYSEKNMALARPMFQIGFKDTDFTTNYAQRIAATKIVLDVIAGESSSFFEGLYTDGLVDGPFILEYAAGSFYGMAVCSNSAERPREAANRFHGELNRLKLEGLDKERFELIKRKHLGRFIRSLNSLENLSHIQMELAFKGIDLFDLLKAYRGVTFEQAAERFNRLFRDDNYATSVVGPEG